MNKSALKIVVPYR